MNTVQRLVHEVIDEQTGYDSGNPEDFVAGLIDAIDAKYPKRTPKFLDKCMAEIQSKVPEFKRKLEEKFPNLPEDSKRKAVLNAILFAKETLEEDGDEVVLEYPILKGW